VAPLGWPTPQPAGAGLHGRAIGPLLEVVPARWLAMDVDTETLLRALSLLALIAVLAILLAGLWNMLRGKNPNRSQILMRWRVGLQFLAIVIAMLLVYLLR
jgi:Hypoxia induced protein conserved region